MSDKRLTGERVRFLKEKLVQRGGGTDDEP